MNAPRRLPNLPVVEALPALREALKHQGRAVLTAPPGSGKTTVVPLALLDEPWLAGRRIVVLEPRRVAARAAAARMAELCGEPVGETVGYQIRFDRKLGRHTRVEVLTEGLLTRRLQVDPDLPGVGLVIFDEFHERSLEADLALALTLDARATLNPELRVLVMSATLDADRVAQLLAAAPVVHSDGRLFPVEVSYHPSAASVPEAVAAGVETALATADGDVLAFLPGARDIIAAQAAVVAHRPGVAVFPLYGALPAADQDAALRPLQDGRRKVILATNLAQTSLTVEGVTQVVDSGWARAARFDLGSGADRLETERISRASADQRAGRAGRLGPGRALRLWSAERQGLLALHDTPEIMGVDLTRFALELAAWGLSPADALLLDPPPQPAWEYAQDLLGALGAVTGEGRITDHGRRLLSMPTGPRQAHLLMRAEAAGLAAQAVWLIAALEERLPTLDLTDVLSAWVAGRGEPAVRRRVRETAQQLGRRLGVTPATDLVARDLARLVAWAYPERVALRRPRGDGVYQCADGRELRLPAHEALARAPLIAAAHWDAGPPRRLRAGLPLEEADLRQDQADRITRQDIGAWDEREQAVIGERQERFGALVLSRKPRPAEDALRIAGVLHGIRRLGLAALPWPEASRQWRQRVGSLRLWQPEAVWPAVDDEALLATLETWLAPYLEGISRREHFSRIPLQSALDGLLDYPAQRALAQLAPTHLTVPSGHRHAVAYEVGAPPVLEVKLQEMFGCTDNPSVCEGRVAVRLHLLSPARRPIAVTADLAGFWRQGYLDVRKDLRGRYPRHPWPEDPLSAAPTARAKPRSGG